MGISLSKVVGTDLGLALGGSSGTRTEAGAEGSTEEGIDCSAGCPAEKLIGLIGNI